MNARKLISFSVENNIAKIELTSPEDNNSLSPAMVEQLTKAIDDSENNPDAHTILLFTKHKTFCSGADLPHMISMFKKSYEDNVTDAKQFASIFLRIYNCNKPVICCVQGDITAGALGLMSACDINIANSDATFHFPEVKLSGVPYAISPFVVKRIGHANAARLMLTAESFNTDEAHRIGLIDHVSSDSYATGLTIASAMNQNNLKSMMETKRWLRVISPLDKAILEESTRLLAKMRMDPNTKSTIEYFVSQKSPKI